MSEQFIEEQNEKFRALLADHLGISIEELDQYGGEIEERTGNDGAVYGHYIRFDSDTPKEVLEKINGIDGNNTVYFDPGELDNLSGDTND